MSNESMIHAVYDFAAANFAKWPIDDSKNGANMRDDGHYISAFSR